ncbi:MAG TPA: malto-oligosyltrehalose trehalohydrolase [Acidimicrobiales bacterium]|jgi:maltooligosyltrehalose trehalohydrolase
MTRRVGAFPLSGETTRFCVWAPWSTRVEVRLGAGAPIGLESRGDGYHAADLDGCPVGTRYRFILDTEHELPDPASRSQPDGVHGPSEVIDLGQHRWADVGYRPRPLWQFVISEIHTGTFSGAGTFDAAMDELDELVAVGINAVEIMPVAQFPGRRNWGYDGAFPFAVQNSYGGAAGLQRLVDACHQRGLAAILDVVYNHLGPEGNVLGTFGPYFTDRYRTPWGPAVNFDGPDSDEVRSYFLDNARQWFSDFHFDALRLDAVHEIIDRTATPFLAALSRQSATLSEALGRPCHLLAESADNDPRVVTTTAAGGLGMDAQWNDDFHHALHTSLTTERSGYYADYTGPDDLARAMDEGFVYQGQHSTFRQSAHGAPSNMVAPERFVLFAQNHDQIGNRPGGDRLVTLVSTEQARLAAAVLLLSPGLPLLFMGEEYGETAPFPYFIDHGDPALTEAVLAGRAREFAPLAEPGHPLDASAEATFEAAKLDRSRRAKPEHAALWELHRDLIALRGAVPALQRSARSEARAWASGGVVTLRRAHEHGNVVALFNFSERPAEGRLPQAAMWIDLLAPDTAARVADAAVALGPWGFGVYRDVSPAS